MYRGLKKNQNYTWLIYTAQNMKNIAIKKEKDNGKTLTNNSFIQNVFIMIKNFAFKIYIIRKIKLEIITCNILPNK